MITSTVAKLRAALWYEKRTINRATVRFMLFVLTRLRVYVSNSVVRVPIYLRPPALGDFERRIHSWRDVRGGPIPSAWYEQVLWRRGLARGSTTESPPALAARRAEAVSF